MSNPFGVTLISLAYLSFVLYLGPFYMKDRIPYALSKTMICYNVCVAVASAVIFHGVSAISRFSADKRQGLTFYVIASFVF